MLLWQSFKQLDKKVLHVNQTGFISGCGITNVTIGIRKGSLCPNFLSRLVKKGNSHGFCGETRLVSSFSNGTYCVYSCFTGRLARSVGVGLTFLDPLVRLANSIDLVPREALFLVSALVFDDGPSTNHLTHDLDSQVTEIIELQEGSVVLFAAPIL